MHDFVSQVLRKYYAQTDWNPFNSYLHLTSASHAVLDFAIPTGLSLSISASPSPPFFTTYRLRALPTLSGALGYIFASVEDDDGNAKGLNIGGNSNDIRFKDVVERFRIVENPWRPVGKQEVFQAGRRVDRLDYLLYGCMHVPSSRVDALFTARLSPTWQILMTAISSPPRYSSRSSAHGLSEKPSDPNLTTATNQVVPTAGLPPGSTNLQINLQQDTGRWFTEYSYSIDDGLLGFRVLHNLGLLGQQNDAAGSGSITSSSSTSDIEGKTFKRVDEESTLESVVGGGLQGRFSIGAELFFSPLEKSAGLSTGVRFTTLPDNPSPTLSDTASLGNVAADSQGQPPTTITATLNPMMGHLSTAYAARMTRDIVACSRFDFNVYSYDSDLTLGAEYWIHSKTASALLGKSQDELDTTETTITNTLADEPSLSEAQIDATAVDRQLQARLDAALSLRDTSPGSSPSVLSKGKRWSLREEEVSNELRFPEDEKASLQGTRVSKSEGDLISKPFSSTLGVIKARLSTSGNVALLWEGRLRNCLVSFGVKADMSSTVDRTRRPLRGVGLDIIYFTQNRSEDTKGWTNRIDCTSERER